MTVWTFNTFHDVWHSGIWRPPYTMCQLPAKVLYQKNWGRTPRRNGRPWFTRKMAFKPVINEYVQLLISELVIDSLVVIETVNKISNVTQKHSINGKCLENDNWNKSKLFSRNEIVIESIVKLERKQKLSWYHVVARIQSDSGNSGKVRELNVSWENVGEFGYRRVM